MEIADKFENMRTLVIEDDESIRQYILTALAGAGLDRVQAEESASDGWERLNDSTFDAIIMDWKTPGLPGITLFNRIRMHSKYRACPVLVVSGFLGTKDFRLLGEFPFTARLEKPFAQSRLIWKLQTLYSEQKWFRQHLEELQAIAKAVSTQRDKGGLRSFAKIMRDAPNPLPLYLIFAQHLVDFGRSDDAKTVLFAVLDRDPQCIQALTEMAKICLRSGELKQASNLLKKAQALSPENVARLCLLGESELQQMNAEGAKNWFEQACRVDPEHKDAQSGKVLASELGTFVAQDHRHVAYSFASFLNASGVALVREGRVDQGIERYQKALEHLWDPGAVGRVAFNVGLGFLRKNDIAEASLWMKKSAEATGTSFEKASAYLKRLEKLAAAGQPAEIGETGAMQVRGEVAMEFESEEFVSEEFTPNTIHSLAIGPIETQTKADLQVVSQTQEKGEASDLKSMDQDPDLLRYYEIVVNEGLYLPYVKEKFERLVERFGPEAFLDAIRENLSANIVQPDEIGFWLQRNGKAKRRIG